MKNEDYQRAIKFFDAILEMIKEHGDSLKIIQNIYLGLGYCYKKLNNFDMAVDSFEKGLCQILSKKSINPNKKYPNEKIIK